MTDPAHASRTQSKEPEKNPAGREEQLKAALRQARSAILELEEEKARRHEPVAIIGLACRFPAGGKDAENLEDFYRSLLEGADSMLPIPSGRQSLWDAVRARAANSSPRAPELARAALLERPPFAADCARFALSPAEARMTDPQHHLLLELAWLALENAGIAPDSLAGSDTGVFAGKTATDFLFDILGTGDRASDDPYTMTGNMHSCLAGRLSYFFDWHGPCVAVEGACATGLVAVAQAMQSLRAGTCSLALAGSVNLLLGPTPSRWLSAMQALAPDGRCRAFAAGATGFGRGEGGAALLLQPLSAALRQDRRVLAVLLGAAVGSDGRSSGFTVPGARGQRQVMRRALEDAGLSPAEVAYVETHGTGTPLGDPIEAESLVEVYAGSETRRDPLRIGSVKSNIGHLEAASGMAGLVKTIAAVQSGRLAPSLHAEELNPLLDWSRLPLQLVRKVEDWPQGHARRIAGVSSFAISGTLAHVLVAQAPPVQESAAREKKTDEVCAAPLGDGLPPLCLSLRLSAPDETLLRGQAEDCLHKLTTRTDFATMCHIAEHGRRNERARLTVAAHDSAEAAKMLEAFIQGKASRSLAKGLVKERPGLLFMYSGQGAQQAGMGRALYARYPAFRQVMDRCEALAAPRLGHSLLETLFAGDDPRLHSTRVTQTAMYTQQTALTELLRALGCRPDAVMGHSIGEYAAAFAAGVFTLESGLDIVLDRGEMAAQLEERGIAGGMAAVLGSEEETAAVLSAFPGLEIIALNGPLSVTVAGRKDELTAAGHALRAAGLESRPMPVSQAFHCALVEPILPDFDERLRAHRFEQPALPYLSCLVGGYLEGNIDWPAYFLRQTRDPVRFHPALLQARERVVLEIGPGSTLTSYGRQCRDDVDWLFAQNPGQDQRQLVLTLGRLFCLGHNVATGAPRNPGGADPEALPPSRFARMTIEPPLLEETREAPVASAVQAPVNESTLRRPEAAPAASMLSALALAEEQCAALKQVFALQIDEFALRLRKRP